MKNAKGSVAKLATIANQDGNQKVAGSNPVGVTRINFRSLLWSDFMSEWRALVCIRIHLLAHVKDPVFIYRIRAGHVAGDTDTHRLNTHIKKADVWKGMKGYDSANLKLNEVDYLEIEWTGASCNYRLK